MLELRSCYCLLAYALYWSKVLVEYYVEKFDSLHCTYSCSSQSHTNMCVIHIRMLYAQDTHIVFIQRPTHTPGLRKNNKNNYTHYQCANICNGNRCTNFNSIFCCCCSFRLIWFCFVSIWFMYDHCNQYKVRTNQETNVRLNLNCSLCYVWL